MRTSDLCRFLASIAFAAGIALVATRGAEARHLYLAVSTDHSEYEIWRFRMNGGFPENFPDLIYKDVTTPFAVGAEGTLYATRPTGFREAAHIRVFPFGSRSPAREITLSIDGRPKADEALAVGASGYLFVSYDDYGPEEGFVEASGPNRAVPLSGIAVYVPKSRGSDPPRTTYSLPVIGTALTVGPHGDLFAGGSRRCGIIACNAYVYDVDHPAERTHDLSHLSVDGGESVAGIQFSDDMENLLVLTGPLPLSEIFVYPTGARGRPNPTRQFAVFIWGSAAGDFGVNGTDVFVAGPARNRQCFCGELAGYAIEGTNPIPHPQFRRVLPHSNSYARGVAVGP